MTTTERDRLAHHYADNCPDRLFCDRENAIVFQAFIAGYDARDAEVEKLREENEALKKANKEKGVVCLGWGDVMIQDSDITTSANGPQVQIDFFQHSNQHKIGDLSTAEEVKIEKEWKHLAVIGSNKVESLDVLINQVVVARDKLKCALRDAAGKGEM